MSIRTACFIGAIASDGLTRWGLLVGSLLLPWVAVVLANASRENSAQGVEYFQAALNAGQEPDTKR